MNEMTSVMARIKGMVVGSRWAGIAGKATAYGAVLAALSLVGSGRFSSWLSPPSKLSIGIAAAHAAPPPTVSAIAAPAEPPPAVDAGVPEDAGAVDTRDGGAGAAGVGADGKVILNLATEQDLRRLPGVGATRAKAILALRGRMKKFTRVEDLMKVKGFGRRTIARLRPLVRVD